MRTILRNTLIFCSLVLMGFGFSACSNNDVPEPVVPEMAAAGQATSWNTAQVTVSTKSISEWAWMVLPANEQVPSETIIFKDGTTVTGADGEMTINIDGLSRLTEYSFYAAAKYVDEYQQEKFYEDVVVAEFTTPDYGEEITIVKTTIEGAEVHVKIPEDVKARGNAIRWGLANKAMYNNNKVQWGQTDASMLDMNLAVYTHSAFLNDTTLLFDEYHRFERDENGELVLDEWMFEPIYYWDFVAPGEPLVLIMAEAAWGESDFGWGEGWYRVPFDFYGYSDAMWFGDMPNEEDYWEEGAYHKVVEFSSAAPEAFEGSVEVGTVNLAPNGGAITLNPSEEVFCYSVGVFDNASYIDYTDMFLGGDESLMQWFSTSYIGMYSIGFQTYYASEGPLELGLLDYFLWELVPGADYHVVVTAMPGVDSEDGMVADPSRQNFQHITFQIPDFTLPAPQMQVTGLEPTSAYKVRFNVKCLNWQEAPIAEASYAMNYVREFDAEMEYNTYESLCETNRDYGYVFSEDEVAQMNSDGGVIVEFDSRENAQSRLAVMGWNEEGRPSTFEGENPTAVAEARSAVLPDAEPIESTLYEDLVGEWTATATVRVQKYGKLESGSYGYYYESKEMTRKITIGDLYCPEAMTEEAYEIYESQGVSRQKADAYFAELKSGIETYNAAVRGQNRLLCTGWDFNLNATATYNPLGLATPWDLFLNTDGYNTSAVEPLMYEFGPKWFLQVAEGGQTAFVPVNPNRIAPLTSWTSGTEYYLVGCDLENEYANATPADEADMDDASKWPNIPVEISEDKQTVTIKSYTDEDGNVYYPNVVSSGYWGPTIFASQVVSDVVMTKGWSEPEATAKVNINATRKAAASVDHSKDAKIAISETFAPMQAPKVRTPFFNEEKVSYKKIEGVKAVSMEECKARMQKLNAAKVRK